MPTTEQPPLLVTYDEFQQIAERVHWLCKALALTKAPDYHGVGSVADIMKWLERAAKEFEP